MSLSIAAAGPFNPLDLLYQAPLLILVFVSLLVILAESFLSGANRSRLMALTVAGCVGAALAATLVAPGVLLYSTGQARTPDEPVTDLKRWGLLIDLSQLDEGDVDACVEACPVMINPLSIIIDLRRYLVMEESAAPAEWNAMFQNVETSFSPWKFAPTDRFNWANELKEKS